MKVKCKIAKGRAGQGRDSGTEARKVRAAGFKKLVGGKRRDAMLNLRRRGERDGQPRRMRICSVGYGNGSDVAVSRRLR